MAVRGAVFLDRDGVINEDLGYIRRVEDVRLLPGSAEAIRELNALSIPVVVVSNQSGLARGLFDEAQLSLVVGELTEQLTRRGARIDGWYHAGFHPDFPSRYDAEADLRKPEPGMLLRAAAERSLSLRHSVIVGDKLSDIRAGLKAGCEAYLVRTGQGAVAEASASAPYPWRQVFDNLGDALQTLIQRVQSG